MSDANKRVLTEQQKAAYRKASEALKAAAAEAGKMEKELESLDKGVDDLDQALQ